MIRNTCAALILLLFSSMIVLAQSEGKITREKYIETYSGMAMKEMQRTDIPASITLAQGCLESDNGNSTLSVKGNNHFGIKCHDWEGGRIYHDDDEKGECFRKYKSAYESYVDHSMFLTTKSRYEFLFDLKPGDYKGWARGLQKAGYATSNKYASLLIKIIEENDLHAYDEMVLSGKYTSGDKPDIITSERKTGRTDRTDRRRDAASGTARKIYKNNRIDYIITEPGDTPDMLREELDLYPNEIYRYNELEKGVGLDSGMIIYLQPKRLHAEKGTDTHLVEEGETMKGISQYYGVKLRSLYKMNNMKEPEEPGAGTELNLRGKVKEERESGRKKRKPLIKESEGEESVPEMKFEFDGF